MATTRKGYKFGVEWIAMNDESGEVDVSVVETIITVGLLADMFGKTTADVAQDVVRFRIREQMAAQRAERRNADRIDGYDRDDLGESPDY